MNPYPNRPQMAAIFDATMAALAGASSTLECVEVANVELEKLGVADKFWSPSEDYYECLTAAGPCPAILATARAINQRLADKGVKPAVWIS